MLKVYGIPNCSTVRKARNFLEDKGFEYEFRDIRKEELSKKEWEALAKADKESRLVNTKSPSFRKLEIPKEEVSTIKAKVDVLLQAPTCMKRPLLVKSNKILSYGFEEEVYRAL